ncbi:MAG: EamA family transporter [Deferrisomatales bacterium]|nr:EamA family transporter [Deferrisomatales bacterium]
MPPSSRTHSVGSVLAAALLWGTTGTAQALAPAGTHPAAVGAMRLAVGGLALLALSAARGQLGRGQPWPPVATALSAMGIAAYQLCFFAGVARTGVAVGTMVAIGSAPIAAGLLGFRVRGERLGGAWLTATALAVTGCSLLAISGGNVRADPVGIALALGAGASYASYTVTLKGLLEHHPPDAVMATVFCLAAILLLPGLFVFDLGWLQQPRGLAVALHLGVVATALAYGLFARGLRTVPVGTAATLSLAEPLAAVLLGVMALGERLSGGEMLGVGLLFAGITLLAAGSRPAARSRRWAGP